MTTDLSSISGNLPTALPVAGGYTPATTPSGGPRVNPLMRYLSAIRRYKWLVLILIAVGVAGGYLTTKLRPQSYVATAQVLLAGDKPQGPFEGTPIYEADALREFFFSYPVITPVAESRRLFMTGPKRLGGPPLPPGPSGPDAAIFDQLTWNPAQRTGSFSLKISPDGRNWDLTDTRTNRKDTGAVGDSIGRAFGFQWQPKIKSAWFGKTFG
ncbi:MAG: hypothetical protein ACRELE_02980, partial [Gemmatimonadales bacterium]